MERNKQQTLSMALEEIARHWGGDPALLQGHTQVFLPQEEDFFEVITFGHLPCLYIASLKKVVTTG